MQSIQKLIVRHKKSIQKLIVCIQKLIVQKKKTL